MVSFYVCVCGGGGGEHDSKPQCIARVGLCGGEGITPVPLIPCLCSYIYSTLPTAVSGVSLTSFELQDLLSRQTINDVRMTSS